MRVLSRFSVSSGDVITVFTCKPFSSGVRRAWESFRASCIRQGFPEPSLHIVNCGNFYSLFGDVRSVVEKLEGDFILVLGSGLRILSHALELVLLYSHRRFDVWYEPESENIEPMSIPREFYELLFRDLSELEKKVLDEVLASPGLRVHDIAAKLGKKDKTIANIVTRLKAIGLIDRRSRGVLKPTGLAVALFKRSSQ